MSWEVELYAERMEQVPVREFQAGLPVKHRAKSIRDVDLLAEFGTKLREPAEDTR